MKRILLAVCLFGFFVVANASAQTAPDVIKLGDVTFTATLRSRIYVWDWFQAPSPYSNQYAYSGNLLRLNFAEKRGVFDWDAEVAVPFLLGLPETATAPAPQGALGLGANYYSANYNHQYAAMAFLKQTWGRYHFGEKESQSIQAGRFEFNDGTELAPKNATLATLKRDRVSQRLIGTFGFSDVGRSFDGVRYSWTQPTADFTFVGATPTRGVFQTDGWGWNRVGFGYAAFTKDWGHGNHAADTRFFAIDYDDFRHILKTDNRPAAVKKGDTENIHLQTWGGHSLHAFTTTAGTIDALGWVAIQTGRWGTQTQRAYAFDVEGGFQPAVMKMLKPWLRGGYTLGSGDGDPNDNRHETFFQILPTPRPYARFPFFNMMNTEDGFGALILRPHPKVTVSNEYHALRLTNANDLWYSGGGVFQPWTFGYTGRATSGLRSLGNLYDTSVEYRANRHATFTGYLGYTQGLSVMETIYPAGKDGRFGYLEALFRM
ncbi:MAG TPA: alginate export family protein [Bryobacteraceae bacterium]|nr:alginate export family protein [Bryobacteraceae bacterium]